MNLNQLSAEAVRTLGVAVGFTIKSLAHPDRKFKVEAIMANGKFAITRLDTGASYFVSGTEDRYEFVIGMARLRELKAEAVELEEQSKVIADRLAEVKAELGAVEVLAG